MQQCINKCIDTLHLQQVMLQERMFVAKCTNDYTRHAQVWLKEAAVVVITWFHQLKAVNTVPAALDH